jgi:hypothetical protein
MVYDPAKFIIAKFPQLTAALTQIARLDEGSRMDTARGQAVDAYGSELLPAILGGDWVHGGSNIPWPKCIPTDLSAHLLWFRRNDNLPSWKNCAVFTHPNQPIVDDGKIIREVRAAGRFIPSFLVAAQPLLKRGIGIWVGHDLSYWRPSRTVCVLIARGLAPEHAPKFGFVRCEGNDDDHSRRAHVLETDPADEW